ncbi:MAG TPA: DUF6069 family protein [Pseudonocardiaceae bacterium]|jgi:hypothetical protein|nr:DUF6069 family protein [Pseudonocardiaceae bacterium]
MNRYPTTYAPPKPDAQRLWAAGGATAVVAALAALVGILIARGLAHVAILAPRGDGAWGNASTWAYVVLSAVAGLLATGLLHFLMVTTPRASQFFGWIMGLLTVVAMVIPLSLVVSTDNKVATALLNLLIGLAITVPLVNVSHLIRTRPVVAEREMPARPVATEREVPPPTREWDV